ncbi:F-box protein [Candidatus Hepatobacter penaei]|uniref:F-box protein n=1 Tax=Candidatus Hepatobacter penaei TaxID=1274402 RepID=UPI00155A73C1|nr:F-box protein [Candidatus Hepatobacter penaei]
MKQFLSTVSLFLASHTVSMAAVPGDGPHDDASGLSSAITTASQDDTSPWRAILMAKRRRAPKDWSEMKQIKACAAGLRITWGLRKKRLSSAEEEAPPKEECAPFYSFDGTIIHMGLPSVSPNLVTLDVDKEPLLKEAMAAQKWSTFYDAIRNFTMDQHGPGGENEADFYISLSLQSPYFLPNASLKGVGECFAYQVSPGVDWQALKLPDVEDYIFENAGVIWSLPYASYMQFTKTTYVLTYQNIRPLPRRGRRCPTTLFHAGNNEQTIEVERSQPYLLRLGFWDDILDDHPFLIPQGHQKPFRFTFFPSDGQAKGAPEIQGPCQANTHNTQKRTLCDLPPGLIQGYIISYLDLGSLVQLRQTCTYMRDCVDEVARDAFVYSPALFSWKSKDTYQSVTRTILGNNPMHLTCGFLSPHGILRREEPLTVEIEVRHIPILNIGSIFCSVSDLTLLIKAGASETPFAKVTGLFCADYGELNCNQYIAAISGIVDENIRRYFRLTQQHRAEREAAEQASIHLASTHLDGDMKGNPEAGPCT